MEGRRNAVDLPWQLRDPRQRVDLDMWKYLNTRNARHHHFPSGVMRQLNWPMRMKL